jgi:hypothetical protein
MRFALYVRNVGGSWVCWEGKRARRRRGNFGVRRGEERMGMGSLFGTLIISQLARENRGSDHLRTVTDAREILFWKKAN